MPKIKRSHAQIGGVRATQTPRGNIPANFGLQQSINQAQAAITGLVQTYIDLEKKENEVRWSNQAMNLHLAGQAAMDNKLFELRQSDLNPSEQRTEYTKFARDLHQRQVGIGKDIHPSVALFVNKNLGAHAISSISAFRVETQAAFVEEQRFTTIGQVEEIRDRAIRAGNNLAPEDPNSVVGSMENINGLLAQKVSDGIYRGSEARALFDQYRDEIIFGKADNFVRANAKEYLEGRARGEMHPGLPKNPPQEVIDKWDASASNALNFIEKESDRQTKKAVAQLKAKQDENYSKAIVTASQGEFQLSHLEQARPGFSADQVKSLESLIRAVSNDTANKPSDKLVKADVWSRLNSLDPVRVESVTEGELRRQLQNGSLSPGDFVAASNLKREQTKAFRDREQTVFDKEAQEGEELIRAGMKQTGFQDPFDNSAQQLLTDTLIRYQDTIRAERRRMKTEGLSPLDIVPGLLIRAQKTNLDKFASGIEKRIAALPLTLRTAEAASRAWKSKNPPSFLMLKQAQRLHELQRLAQEEAAKQAASAPQDNTR